MTQTSMYERVRDEQSWTVWESGECENPRCKRESRKGRPVHVIMHQGPDDEKVILPTYHFATAEEGKQAWVIALLTAPTIESDDDLYAARINQTPHKLPVGWIDPSYR